MFKIIQDFLWDTVFGEQGLNRFFQSSNMQTLLYAFDIQLFFDTVGISMKIVCNTIYLYSFYLIILKFVKKMLDIYALQTDGDAGTDILTMIANFCKAMVLAMSFTTIWNWMMEIAVDFSMDLINTMALGSSNTFINEMKVIGETASDTPLFIIIPLFIGLTNILRLCLMKDAVELWILRLGVPLACCGLLDADQGVYKQYMRSLFKAVLTIIIQVFLMNLALYLMTFIRLDNLGNAILLGVYAIMTVAAAFATPKLLSEFLAPKQGGGGKVMQAVYMGSFLLRGVM